MIGSDTNSNDLIVFGNLTNPIRIYYQSSMTAETEAVSTSMMSYWAQFAYTGDPGRGRSGEEVGVDRVAKW